MMLVPQTFTSDSELWVKPLATGDTTTVIVDPQCNISRLNFVGGKNSISQPIPNPSTGRVTLNVEFVEDGYPNLRIYDESGDEVVRPVDAPLNWYILCSFRGGVLSRYPEDGDYEIGVFRSSGYRSEIM